jgi:hypothetical protein
MLKINEAVNELESNDRFQSWHQENKECYLCHCMQMLTNEDAWYIGYYNPNSDEITTFAISETALTKESTEKVFKHPDKKVEKLDFEKVKIFDQEVLAKVSEICKNNYSNEVLSKNIFILQTIDNSIVYNVTIMTMAMNAINIKISAIDGRVLSHRKTSLMDMTSQLKKEE